MGTRNLTMVKLNNKIVVAQYGQWDGYPTGQGENIAAFIQGYLADDAGVERFAKRVADVRFGSKKEIEAKYKAWEALEAKQRKGDYVAKYEIAEFSVIDRDTGSNILHIINGSYGFPAICGDIVLQNHKPFLKDGLFCEYAYCIDLGKRVVEVYAGTQKPVVKIPFAKFTVGYMATLEKELQEANVAADDAA